MMQNEWASTHNTVSARQETVQTFRLRFSNAVLTAVGLKTNIFLQPNAKSSKRKQECYATATLDANGLTVTSPMLCCPSVDVRYFVANCVGKNWWMNDKPFKLPLATSTNRLDIHTLAKNVLAGTGILSTNFIASSDSAERPKRFPFASNHTPIYGRHIRRMCWPYIIAQ